jgi:hypothetical protein
MLMLAGLTGFDDRNQQVRIAAPAIEELVLNHRRA